MSVATDARRFMQRATQLLAPFVEAEFGQLPPYGLADYPIDLPPGHPDRNESLGGRMKTGYDLRTGRLAIFYDPGPFMRAVEAGEFFYINMIVHELTHLSQIAAVHAGCTHQMIVEERSRPYQPSDKLYWLEGTAMLAEQQVMLRLVESGGWRSIAGGLYGNTSARDVLWSINGLGERIFIKLASTVIVASRLNKLPKPDSSLLHLPFKLPDWLEGRLRYYITAYDGQFADWELPYYIGGYYCCLWMQRHGIGISQLLRTIIKDEALFRV